jgi:integrase
VQSLIFQQYEERLRRLKAHEGTLSNLRAAAQLLNGHDGSTLQGWEIEEVLAGSGLAPSTQHTRLASIRAAYRYGIRRGIVTHDPTEDVRLERIQETEPKIIPNGELRQVLRDVAPNRELLAYLLAYTGARRNEIRELRWEDVNLVKQTLTVKHGKGGRMRYVPIHPALGEVMAGKWRMGQSGCSVVSWRVIEKEISPGYSAHDYRRTVATSLYVNGVSEPVIDKILGWAPRTTARRHYLRVVSQSLHDGILKLYADDPI